MAEAVMAIGSALTSLMSTAAPAAAGAAAVGAPLNLLAGTAGATASAAGAAGGFGGLMAGLGQLLPIAGGIGSILQGVASVQSVSSGLVQSQMRADALNEQADDALFSAGLEETQGIERRTSLKKQFVQYQGERDAAIAASGVDMSFGTPAIAREAAARDAESALSMDQDTTNMRINRFRERAATQRQRAGSVLESSQREAFWKVAGIGADFLKRGVGSIGGGRSELTLPTPGYM
jgi:hypothetical protein